MIEIKIAKSLIHPKSVRRIREMKVVNLKYVRVDTENIIFDGENVIFDGEQLKG